MIYGFIIFIVGVLMVINEVFPQINLGLNSIWPVALIFLSIYQMFKNKAFNGTYIIMFYIGFFFFINNNIVNIRELFFPFLVVMIGLTIIASSYLNKDAKAIVRKKKDDVLVYNAFFSSVDDVASSDDFKGADILSIFGGCDVDFSHVKLKKDNVVITILSIFGGSNIKVPEDVNVRLNSSAIFGGDENKKTNVNPKQKTIIINSTSIFGGTEIK